MSGFRGVPLHIRYQDDEGGVQGAPQANREAVASMRNAFEGQSMTGGEEERWDSVNNMRPAPTALGNPGKTLEAANVVLIPSDTLEGFKDAVSAAGSLAYDAIAEAMRPLARGLDSIIPRSALEEFQKAVGSMRFPAFDDFAERFMEATRTPQCLVDVMEAYLPDTENPETYRPLANDGEAATRVKQWLEESPATLNPYTGRHDAAAVSRALGISKPTAKKYMEDPRQMNLRAMRSLTSLTSVHEWYDLMRGPGACERAFAEEGKDRAIEALAEDLRAMTPEQAKLVMGVLRAVLEYMKSLPENPGQDERPELS